MRRLGRCDDRESQNIRVTSSKIYKDIPYQAEVRFRISVANKTNETTREFKNRSDQPANLRYTACHDGGDQ